jgi:hypothetical protein
MSPSRQVAVCASILAAALLLVYLPDVGHGFLKDDFAWIHDSRSSGPGDLLRLFTIDNGFYRPLVGLSFAGNEWLFGLRPFAYGVTNLALLIACSALLWAMGRGLGMAAGTALLATAVWVFNPHGIPMSVLWISGRTSLLLTLCSLLAARSVLQARPVSATVFCLAALLSKEEAILLPPVLMVLAGRTPDADGFSLRRALRAGWPPLLGLAPYFALRARTAAYLPHTAPDFYRPTLDLPTLARNVLEYLDRSATFGLALLVLLALLVRRRPRLEPRERGWLTVGAVWLACGYGITVFLPVRSSLYACFPSVGVALLAATVGAAVWREAGPAARRRLIGLALLVPFALVPVYRARAVRWVRPAEVSARVLEVLSSTPLASGTVVVLHDEPGIRWNLADVFGTLVEDAARLHLGAAIRIWIDPPPPNWQAAGLRPPEPDEPARHFSLRHGDLVPAAPGEGGSRD